MKRVIIESPYNGEVELNEGYAELAMRDCLLNYNEAPFASHLLYTRRFALNDNDASQRILGINAGFAWRDNAEKTVFYIDLGISSGMLEGIKDCEAKNQFYETRVLPEDLWNIFKEYAKLIGITIT
jgi:hypothetical protein